MGSLAFYGDAYYCLQTSAHFTDEPFKCFIQIIRNSPNFRCSVCDETNKKIKKCKKNTVDKSQRHHK